MIQINRVTTGNIQNSNSNNHFENPRTTERELFSISRMKIRVTSRHLQSISRKEKLKLVADIVILNYLPVRVNVSVFLHLK